MPLAGVAFAVRAFGKISGKPCMSGEMMIEPDAADNDSLRIELSPAKK